MKVTIFSESPNDEAALRILVETILGEKIEEVPRQNQLRSRGVDKLLEVAPIVIRAAYYQTESEAIVIVCDSDDEPIHDKSHEEENNIESHKCRLCILKRIVSETLVNLKPLSHRQMIKTAVGVAVPSIEAWLLCGMKSDTSEDKWKRKMTGETVRYDKTSLKRNIYGERPFKQRRMETAISEATRIAQKLELLEEKFPEGFGNLVREIKSW